MLWQADLFQAKWSIVAKAYSVIRDIKGKDLAPLAAFLKIACPLVGIIAPEEYLTTLGWDISIKDGEKRINRSFIPDFNGFEPQIQTTAMSVDDVVNHCKQVGYCSNNRPGSGVPIPMESAPFMVMTARIQGPMNPGIGATAASPGGIGGPSQTQLNANPGADVLTGNHQPQSASGPDITTSHALATDGAVSSSTTEEEQFSAEFTAAVDMLDEVMAETAAGNSNVNANELVNNPALPSMFGNGFGGNLVGQGTEAVEPPKHFDPAWQVKKCMRQLRESGDEYPYYDQFDPYGDPEKDLQIDMFGDYQFNTYDMSQAVNTDDFVYSEDVSVLSRLDSTKEK